MFDTKEDVRVTGLVTKWFDKKGFGFIKFNNKEFFVHISNVVNGQPLTVGETVTFKRVGTQKGEQAFNVDNN